MTTKYEPTKYEPTNHFEFEEFGVSIEIKSAGNYLVVATNPQIRKPEEVRTRIVNLAIYKVEEGANAIKLPEDETVSVTIKVGIYESEANWSVYTFDDNGRKIKGYSLEDREAIIEGPFLGRFDGFLVFNEEEFPDPNVGIGP
jgi:hypothetical protein